MANSKTRKIVHIDEDKCDGCGACVPNCAEGAIKIVDGKARLVADNLCDGLGACLGHCPKDAIRIEERPAEEFSEEAVKKVRAAEGAPAVHAGGAAPDLPCGCPGSMMRKFESPAAAPQRKPASTPCACSGEPSAPAESKLGHWPVQLKLLPENADLWKGADIVLAADCTAFALPDFHDRLLEGKTLAIACPKLDDAQFYVEKLGRILAANDVRSLTVARMEVPCCGGLVRIAELAVQASGKDIPLKTVTVSVRGQVASY